MARVQFKVTSKGLAKLLTDLHANAKGFEGILHGVPVEVWPVFVTRNGKEAIAEDLFTVSVYKGTWKALCKTIEFKNVAARYQSGV